VLGRPPAGVLDVVGALVGGGEALDEPAGVAVVGQRRPGPAGQDRLAQPVDLAAGVVDVELAGDGVAGAFEDAGQGVAVGGEPPVPDVDRPGGVGRHELDHDPLAVADVQSPEVVFALRHHVPQHVVQPGGGEVEVDEPGAGELDPGGVGGGRGGEHVDDLGRQLPGVAPGGLGGGEGDVGGPVPVLPPGGPLEPDRGGGRDAELVEGVA
jgi:hypothetical protein